MRVRSPYDMTWLENLRTKWEEFDLGDEPVARPWRERLLNGGWEDGVWDRVLASPDEYVPAHGARYRELHVGLAPDLFIVGFERDRVVYYPSGHPDLLHLEEGHGHFLVGLGWVYICWSWTKWRKRK